mmetsp:Transcript_84053/g.242985  ORF Transcript_84053/g.242985 Transcript_84053/m.242985 type:complete len:219 (-) Transcript_84053:285-941(-)
MGPRRSASRNPLACRMVTKISCAPAYSSDGPRIKFCHRASAKRFVTPSAVMSREPRREEPPGGDFAAVMSTGAVTCPALFCTRFTTSSILASILAASAVCVACRDPRNVISGLAESSSFFGKHSHIVSSSSRRVSALLPSEPKLQHKKKRRKIESLHRRGNMVPSFVRMKSRPSFVRLRTNNSVTRSWWKSNAFDMTPINMLVIAIAMRKLNTMNDMY